MNSTAATPASALWAHALNVYAQHAASLLQAQDQFGADVCLLLYAHWRAQSGICLTAEDWQQILDATATQRAQISALRERRRQLKPRTKAPVNVACDAVTELPTATTKKENSAAAETEIDTDSVTENETVVFQHYTELKAQELAAEKQMLETLNICGQPRGAGDMRVSPTRMSPSSCWQASVQAYAQQLVPQRGSLLTDLLRSLLC